MKKALDRAERIVYAPRFIFEDTTLRRCSDPALDPVLVRAVEG